MSWRSLVLVSFFAGVIILIPASTGAVTKSAGLQVTPLRTYPVLGPGESTTGYLNITNSSPKNIKVSLSTEIFSVVNEDYDYKLTSSDELSWVRFIDQAIKIAPGKSSSIPYALQVPADATPGGHYFALIASDGGTKDSSNINEIKRVASLVYLEVRGQLVKKADLISFKSPWFVNSNSLVTDFRLSNSGNTHVRSRLSVSLQRWPFGSVVEQQQLENLLLPSTVRRLSAKIGLSQVPGIYRVIVRYSPPQGGQVEKHHYLIFVPLWLQLVLAALFMWIAWLVWRQMATRRRFND